MVRTVYRFFLNTTLALCGVTFLFADQVAVTNFKGLLNNNNNSVTIDPSTAQDLLNVDVTPGGLSVKKRSGYGVYKALATTKPMHGGYHSFDATGNDIQIWGSSTSLYGIVGDATPTQLVSSATLNSTWDCADTQGNSYCVNSNRDAYIRTNGATITWFSSPLGTMVEATPDRVVVAGVSATPNTLFVSQSNTFTNFTVGVNATDAFTEVIAAPGSHLTHIRWGCGKLLWWKDQSFGYFDFNDQFSAQIKIVSDVIGTFDNTSAIDPGGQVWFRGQDGHTWKYDCSGLTKESIEITPNVELSGRRTANSWTQTTQADFSAGVSSPTVNLSTSISVGDVIVSSWVAIDSTTANFQLGSVSNVTIGTNTVLIATDNAGNVSNNSFESGSGRFADTWSYTEVAADWAWVTSVGLSPSCSGATLNPQNGSRFIKDAPGACSNPVAFVEVLDQNTGAVLDSLNWTGLTSCLFTQLSIPFTSSNYGKRATVRFSFATGCGIDTVKSAPFVYGGQIKFYGAIDFGSGTNPQIFLDNVTGGSSTITTGSFTSRIFNTGFSTSTVQVAISSTSNTEAITFVLQHSPFPSSGFTDLTTTLGGNSTAHQYLRYISTFTIAATDSALSTLNSVTLLARSSGTYISAVKNAPNLSSWSTLGVNSINNGGTHSFFMRSSTSVFTLAQTTPTWTAQTAGGLITISTGPYFQFRDDFSITAATQTPTLNDFTVNWFEGAASDQAYMFYFSNAIWQSVAYGGGQAVNNYIFKYDLINEGWTLYNFGANGMLVEANTLYFGDTSAGNIFNYGTVTSDNGTAINAYWRSKSFTGSDPFIQNQLTQIDTFSKKNQGSTITATYTLDTSTTTTSYSINLSSTTQTLVQSRKLLPSGKLGYTFDIQYGDTSTSSAWELLGFRIGYLPQPYRPTP